MFSSAKEGKEDEDDESSIKKNVYEKIKLMKILTSKSKGKAE